MSEKHLPPPPPSAVPSLYKQNTWSPETFRDEVWQRRKENQVKRRRGKSVTDEDLDELKACMELGFGFGLDSPKIDQRLSETFPAYSLFYAVNKDLNDIVSMATTSSGNASDSVTASPFGPGEGSEIVKTRLKQWAQVVACSLRHSSGN